MSDLTPGSASARGTMHVRDGVGVVRLEVRLPLSAAELWPVLTQADRLVPWLGEVDGELHEGGTFRARWTASGWEGTCQVVECRPPELVRLLTQSEDEPDGAVEIRLSEDADGTVLVLEDSGLPVDALPAYAAGDQIHLEDLVNHLQGGPMCDARARWQELHAVYLAQGAQ